MTYTEKVLIASMVLVSLVYVTTGAEMDHPTPRLPKEEVEACEKEAGANIQDVKNKGGSLNEELAEKGDCLKKCILTKEGALKSDGTIDLDEFKKNFAKISEKDAPTKLACLEKIERVETCKDMRKIDACLRP